MKRKIFILSMAILSIALVFSSCDWGSKKTSNKAQTTVTTTADPCASQNAEIQNLLKQIGDLKAENARLQAELDCANSKLPSSKRTTATTKTTTSSAKSSASTPAPAATTKSATIPASSGKASTVATGSPSNANLNGLRENGIISFCVMANGDRGLHFPQKALDKGVTFTSIETNPSNDGHNWIVEPVEYIDGDYGLTVDGIFFVSNAMMVKVLQGEGIQLSSVKIKAPFTKWEPINMYLEDGFWKYNALNR